MSSNDGVSSSVHYTRRYFLKTVIFGSTAAGLACRDKSPAVLGAGASLDTGATATATAAAAPPSLGKSLAGESFERCHMVRDGVAMPAAPVTATHDVVIAGGGPSGLCAAYRLRDRDVLLLEKENVLGGNCTFDEWEGVRMSTGGAFYTLSETNLVALFDEIGARGSPVVGTDSLVINGQPIIDIFRDGATKLPFPQKVQDDFRRSRDDLVKVYKTKSKAELDAIPFAKFLEPYSPEVKQFWDRFGKSNWGADSVNSSAYIGTEAYTWAGGMADPRWTHPGGLGGAAKKLGEVVTAALGQRAVTGAAIYRIEREGKGAKERVVVSYVQNGEPKAVRARAVIVALPKVYTKLIVPGLPAKQVADMKLSRYEPFVVFNLCLNTPGPEPAFDNWFLDTPFTDFIPADWIIHAGKGPPQRKTALTVYQPMKEEERAFLLIDDALLAMADNVVEHLERHFPGTREKIAEIRIFRRGHAMFLSAPGRFKIAERMAQPFGPVLFAHTDLATFASFDGALLAADKAVERARKLIR